MKKLFALLAVLIILAMTSCSGGGGGSSSGGTTETASAIIDSNGGSVQLKDGASVTIPAGVVADNTKVTLSRLSKAQLYASQATAVTDTYEVEIDGNIPYQSSDDEEFVTFRIPVAADINATVKKAPSNVSASVSKGNSDDAYNATEVAIYNGDSTIGLYGSYTASNGALTIHVPANALISDLNSSSIKITGVNVKKYFPPITAAINDVTSLSKGNNVSFTEVSNDQTSKLATKGQAKTPIILIHGWQIFNDASNPQGVWNSLVKYLTSDSDFNDNFELYSFTYDTSRSLNYNGYMLAEKISSSFPSQDVIIIGHSMGGLVAHSYIQKYGGGSKVIKLITLGTPYHGSPLIQFLRTTYENGGTAVVGLVDVLTTLNRDGATDLEWDNYDGKYPNLKPDTTHLSDLNNSLKTNYANLYTAFAGSTLIPQVHDKAYQYGYIINWLFTYNSDGIVPLVSAFNDNHPSGFVTIGPENDYDHHQICAGKISSDPLFIKIKNLLLNFSSRNLTPYQPDGWSDKIVVSTSAGNTIDTSALTSNDDLYVDWAYINNGTLDITQDHKLRLYLDDVLVDTEPSSSGCSPLKAGYYCHKNDFLLGKLSSGTHRIKMVVDADNQLTENNENDNSYTKTITVGQSYISDGTLTGINGYDIAAIIDYEPNSGGEGTPISATITFTKGGSLVSNIFQYWGNMDVTNWQFTKYEDCVWNKISPTVWQVENRVLTGNYGVNRYYAVTTTGTKIAVGDIWINGPSFTIPDWEHDGIGDNKGGQALSKSIKKVGLPPEIKR